MKNTFIFNFAAAISLFVLVFAAYEPSLQHMPRADQVDYMACMIDHTSFGDIIAHSYSYNRTRTIHPGDVMLFRPVLFSLLAFERSQFGNDFSAPQMIGIILHFLLVFMMYMLMSAFLRYFSKVYNTDPALLFFFPFLLSAFFALNFNIMELVVWTHINGYILFWLLVLIVFYCSFKFLVENKENSGRGWVLILIAWGLMFIAAFTYELGQYFAVLFGLYLAAVLYKKEDLRTCLCFILGFSLIALIYALINSLDYAQHLKAGEFTEDINFGLILNNVFSPGLFDHLSRYLLYTVIQPFFAFNASGYFYLGRVMIPEYMAGVFSNLGLGGIISLIIFIIWVTLTVISIVKFISSRPKRIGVLSIFIFLSFFILYLFIIVFGRMNIRPDPDLLKTDSYYTYPAFMLWILLSFLFWTNGFLRFKSKIIIQIVSFVLAVGIVSETIAGGIKVYKANVDIAGEMKVFRDTIASVSKFVEAHKKEKNFSIAFDMSSPTVLSAVQVNSVYFLIFFKKYINNSNPSYILKVHGNDFTVQKPYGVAK